MREIISKQQTEYTRFLCDLATWREALENRDWAPWDKPKGDSDGYKCYRDLLQKFTSLQSSLPTLTPRQIIIRDKNLVDVVKELKKLSDDLASRACTLIREDKMYLFNPLVQVTILAHVHKQDFLESLSEAVRHKSKAATHGNKKNKSKLFFLTAFLLSHNPRARASHIHKFLDKRPVRRLLVGDKGWDKESFRKWFKNNRAEILALLDRSHR